MLTKPFFVRFIDDEFAPDELSDYIAFDWANWHSQFDNQAEHLTTYTDMEAQLILALLRLPLVPELWTDEDIEKWNIYNPPYQTIRDVIEGLEYKFMTNISLEHLVKSNLLLTAAITGRPLDLSTLDVDAHLNQAHDYSQYGLANRLNQPGYAEDGNTLADAIREQELSPSIPITVEPPVNNFSPTFSPDNTFSPTNNIETPVNNFSPTFSPDNTVNFDTEEIATAINTQSNRIAPDGQSLYGATTVLADRVAPTGESLNTTALLLHQDLEAISGKLAPDGENLKDALDELQCICEHLQIIADLQQSDLEAYIPVMSRDFELPVDVFKCDQAKWIIAYHSDVIQHVSWHYGLFLVAVNFSLFLSGLVKYAASFFTSFLDDVAVKILEYGFYKLFAVAADKSDFDAFLVEWNVYVPDLICDIYGACNGSEALQNLQARAETFQTDKTRDIARLYIQYILVFSLSKMFVQNDLTQEEMDEFADGMNTGTDSLTNPVAPAWPTGWDSQDCDDCDPCGGVDWDDSCFPQTGVITNGSEPSGDLFLAGVWSPGPDVWQEVDSVQSSPGYHHMDIDIDQIRQLEIETVSQANDVTIELRDCADDIIQTEVATVAVPNIGTHEFAHLHASAQGAFTIRIRRVGQ